MKKVNQETLALIAANKGKTSVLHEDIVIDGKVMTVAQLALGYRKEKRTSKLFALSALIAVLMFSCSSYWFEAHQRETIVQVAPTK